MSLISKSQNDLICNNIETNSNDSNSINNLIINNNNNNNNNNSFIQLSQLSTQGLPLNAFLEGLISSVGNNSEKPDVWSDVLLDMIDNNVIQSNDKMLLEVLKITVDKSQSQLLSSRLFSCKMLAKLSIRLDEFIVINKILPLVQCLCHDFESVVRVHMCQQLFIISQNISLESTKTQIVPQLLELSKDKETIVRMACIESIINLLPKLDTETIIQTVLPLIILMFDEALKADDNCLPIIFLNFGKLCQTLPKDFIAREEWFLNYFCTIYRISNDSHFFSKEKYIQCKTALALNIPLLIQIYGAVDSLISILDSLCTDDNKTVVTAIATVFHQIISFMANPYLVYPQLSKLLCHKCIDVLKVLMPFLADILIATIISTEIKINEQNRTFWKHLVKNLIECENTISAKLDWRLHLDFFKNLSRLMHYIPVKIIQRNLISLLTNRILTARPIPLRIGASRCILIAFRDIPNLLQDLNIYEWFVKNLCYAKSCYQRMLFLNVCELMHELCDKSIILTYIFEPLLHLRKDKVPNIRLHMCKTFIILFHPLLPIPQIKQRLSQLKLYFFEMLINESDRDVIESINSLIEVFEWRQDFNKLEVEELTTRFDNLSINCSQESHNLQEENNAEFVEQETNSNRINAIKTKSFLPQPIRHNSQSNVPQMMPTIHINIDLHSIPSKIPKPINKSMK